MEVSSSDVLIVGGGGAGLRAAIAVAEAAPRLRVAVMSKVYPMRSHTVSAEGGAAAVIKAGDSLDLAGIRDEMQRTMGESAGIYRSARSLARAAEKLDELSERFRDLSITDRSRTFDTEPTAALAGTAATAYTLLGLH